MCIRDSCITIAGTHGVADTLGTARLALCSFCITIGCIHGMRRHIGHTARACDARNGGVIRRTRRDGLLAGTSLG
eukprot:5481460-Alexandrium_andersonii.AAC.1